jgi:hypothetical protein
MAIRAFISYSHKDADLLTQLHEHLSALQRQELLDSWTDRKIQAGSIIDDKVEAQIEQAQLYLLLISSAFIQSDYCFEKEFARACERQKAGEAIIVPIIIRECDWKIPELRRFKALPEDGKPVVSRHWHSPDEAFANVTAGLRTLIEQGPFPKAKRRRADKVIKEMVIHDKRHVTGERRAERRTVTSILRPPAGIALLNQRTSPASASTENPKAFNLTTNKTLPQWADYRELNLDGKRLERLMCKITTSSSYFRFGFKLLCTEGRIFGDGCIKSQDTNLLVHIGRNNWDRLHLGITARDIFFSHDVNGQRLDKDKKLFKAEMQFSASLEIKVESGYLFTFVVNDQCCLSRIIPPEICRRIVMLGWGDNDDYVVKVQNLTVTTAHVL